MVWMAPPAKGFALLLRLPLLAAPPKPMMRLTMKLLVVVKAIVKPARNPKERPAIAPMARMVVTLVVKLFSQVAATLVVQDVAKLAVKPE